MTLSKEVHVQQLLFEIGIGPVSGCGSSESEQNDQTDQSSGWEVDIKAPGDF